jgi:hypothetical protein
MRNVWSNIISFLVWRGLARGFHYTTYYCTAQCCSSRFLCWSWAYYRFGIRNYVGHSQRANSTAGTEVTLFRSWWLLQCSATTATVVNSGTSTIQQVWGSGCNLTHKRGWKCLLYIDRGRWIMIWAICMQEGTPRFNFSSAASQL